MINLKNITLVALALLIFNPPTLLAEFDAIFYNDLELNTISRAELDGSNVEVVVPTGQTSSPDFLAIHTETEKLFWVEQGMRIMSADLDGSNILEVIPSLSEVQSLTVDQVNNQLYYTDSLGTSERGIFRANLDGSGVTQINTGQGMENPTALALDAAGEKIYYTDPFVGRINVVDYDGSNYTEVAFRSGATGLPAISLDLENGHIYWVNGGSAQAIERTTIDPDQAPSAGFETVVSFDFSPPSSLVVDDSVSPGPDLYWVDQDTISIIRRNLSTQESVTLLSDDDGLIGPQSLTLKKLPEEEEVPVLVPGTEIEDAPEVLEVETENKLVVLQLKEFSGASLDEMAFAQYQTEAYGSPIVSLINKSPQVRYEVTAVRQTDGRIKKKISKTHANVRVKLGPGAWKASYNAKIVTRTGAAKAKRKRGRITNRLRKIRGNVIDRKQAGQSTLAPRNRLQKVRVRRQLSRFRTRETTPESPATPTIEFD